MGADEVFNYVMETPENTNPNVLRSLLNNLDSGINLPDNPAQDGTYNLQNTVSSGTGTLSWASGGSSSGVLVVKFTSDRDGWTCDKTYAEIVSAITSGTPVMCLTSNSETGNVNYHQYTQAVNALFFDEGDSTLDVTTLTIDSSNSIDESVHSITLTYPPHLKGMADDAALKRKFEIF